MKNRFRSRASRLALLNSVIATPLATVEKKCGPGWGSNRNFDILFNGYNFAPRLGRNLCDILLGINMNRNRAAQNLGKQFL